MVEDGNYAQNFFQIEKGKYRLEGPGLDGKKKTDNFFSN
jgi:hypothetical protein